MAKAVAVVEDLSGLGRGPEVDQRAEGRHLKRGQPSDVLDLLFDEGKVDRIGVGGIKHVSHQPVQEICLQLDLIFTKQLPKGLASDVNLLGLAKVTQVYENLPSSGASKHSYKTPNRGASGHLCSEWRICPNTT